MLKQKTEQGTPATKERTVLGDDPDIKDFLSKQPKGYWETRCCGDWENCTGPKRVWVED